MIWFFISGVAVVACAAWVLLPWLTKGEGTLLPDRSADLLEQRMAIYRSMLDLELDHSTGKISDEDLIALREEHESEALELIRSDSAQTGSEPDLLELEIAEARRRLSKGR